MNKLFKSSLGIGLGTLFLFANGSALAETGSRQLVGLLWLYSLPDWILAVLVIIPFMGLAWLGLALYRRLRRNSVRNPRASYYAIIAGGFAGITVAFMAAGPWQAYLFEKIADLPPTAAGPSATLSQDLFEEPDTEGAGKSPEKPNKVRNDRARHVKVKMSAIDADTLNLNLFDDTDLLAIRDRVVKDLRGGSVWVGHIDNELDSEVVLAAKGNVLMGTVRTQGRFFEIVYVNGNTHAVRELDPNKMPAQFEPESIQQPLGNVAGDTITTAATTASGDTTTSTGQVIDVMVVYSPKARSNAGGSAGIETKIMNAVTRANQAYLNSQVNMQVNLVYMGEVAYTETGNMTDALPRLQNATDGYIDDVHALRNQYAADQVVLIAADSNYCGYGYTMTSAYVSAAFAPYAFAVLHDDSVYNCLGSNDSLAHELGHNQGNQHNPESSSSAGAYPDAYGYRICGLFRDIMAYPCSGEVRIPYFSNPNVLYNGQPTGIPGFNDTARSMNATVATVANFRTSVTTAPTTPSNLAAMIPTVNSIKLTWSDAANNETGYRLQRAINGGTWSEVAALGQNATSFTDTNLVNGQYAYRVYAYNSVGNSAYSNTASTTLAPLPVTGPDTTPPVVKITNPQSGAKVSKTVSISLNATDNVGISSLKLYIDNSLVSATNSGTLSYSWNTNKIAAGNHAIKAEAVDTSGNQGSVSISVIY